MSYYAVAKGKTVGIFSTWNECQEQVKGCKGATYKKFSSLTEAEQFISEKTGKPFTSVNPLQLADTSCNEPRKKVAKLETSTTSIMGNQVILVYTSMCEEGQNFFFLMLASRRGALFHIQ